MKRLLVGALVVVALAGCSPISSGYITGKDYEPAYTYTTTDCKAWTTDENGLRRCVYYGTTEHYVPDYWDFNLIKYQDGGDPITGWVQVDEATWNSYEVGDWYDGDKK